MVNGVSQARSATGHYSRYGRSPAKRREVYSKIKFVLIWAVTSVIEWAAGIDEYC